MYKFSLFLRSVGHRVTTHKVTPPTVHERGDIEIRDYVFLPREEDNRIPPHTLLMDVTMTHDHLMDVTMTHDHNGRTTQHTNGALTQSVLYWSSSV